MQYYRCTETFNYVDVVTRENGTCYLGELYDEVFLFNNIPSCNLHLFYSAEHNEELFTYGENINENKLIKS